VAQHRTSVLRLGCRLAVAAAVDGQDRITVLQVEKDWTLPKQQDLSIPGLALPTALQVLKSMLLCMICPSWLSL